MLEAGARIPVSARVWTAEGGAPVALADALPGEGLVLACFYPFDWSPT